MMDLEALRSGGELLPHGQAQDARIFIIENEPLLDMSPVSGSAARLTLYGLPGTPYRVQSSSAMGAQWIDGPSLDLEGTHQSLEIPADVGGAFFRAIKE